jgi:hypothetical protein
MTAFSDPKVSLPYPTQQPVKFSYSEPDKSNSRFSSLLSYDLFNIILLSMPRSSELSLPLRLANQILNTL